MSIFSIGGLTITTPSGSAPDGVLTPRIHDLQPPIYDANEAVPK